jgi:transcriptional regulator with XRE-family HTH domain
MKAGEASLLKALGKRVRELRKARGLSQERLAELADIHENHVRRIEAGTANPSYLVLVRIGKALGVRPGELIDGKLP